MKMFLAGNWLDKSEKSEVHNPFDGSVVDTVPKADAADVDQALAAAVEGARLMRAMPGYERFQILNKAAQLMHERRTIWPARLASKKAKPFAKPWPKPRGPPKRSSFRPKKPSGSAAKCCRWTAPPMARESSALRCECPAAWWPRLRRSTFRSICRATKSARRWRPAMPWCSSRPATRR